MGRKVTIAYEKPRSVAREGNAYVGAVRRALTKMGADQELAVQQESYVKQMHAAGVPAVTTAALLRGHPHMHAVVGVAAEEPVHRAEIVSEPPRPPGTVAGPFWLVNGSLSGPIMEARDSGGFAQVKRDVPKYEAAMARAKLIGPLDNDRQVFRFLRSELESEDQEVFVVLGLDLNNSLRVYTEIARGQRDRVAVVPADVMRPILIEGAAAFIACHNHPSGDPSPSEQDKALTEQLRAAAKPYEPGVVFLDHIIVGSEGRYYSFSDKRVKRG